MNLLTAILLTIVLAVTPSVLFLLFWRFLIALRDDALLARLKTVHGFDLSEEVVNPLAVGTATRSPTLVTCPDCGARTARNHDRCVGCGSPLQ